MIPVKVEERIAKIRTKVREGRTTVAALRATAPKEEADKASKMLDDVDGYLVPSILNERRTGHQWDFWLRGAEAALAIAVEHVGKFKPGAKIIGV